MKIILCLLFLIASCKNDTRSFSKRSESYVNIVEQIINQEQLILSEEKKKYFSESNYRVIYMKDLIARINSNFANLKNHYPHISKTILKKGISRILNEIDFFSTHYTVINEKINRIFNEVFSKVDYEDAYKILDIKNGSSLQVVRRAYHKLSLKYHPDKNGEKSEKEQNEAKEKFIKINKAYQSLSELNKK